MSEFSIYNVDVPVAQQPDLPDRFHRLPRDLQGEVIKHTAASFFVEWHSIHQFNDAQIYSGSVMVPVIARWEFKLERRLGTEARGTAGERKMKARFIQDMDPQFKSTSAWLSISQPWHQRILENWCHLHDYHDDFQDLRVNVDESDKYPSDLTFIKKGFQNQSHPWSGFHHNTLFELRDKLLSNFGMHLKTLDGRKV